MFAHLPQQSIIEKTDIVSIKPRLECLDYISLDLAQKTQTLVFDKEDHTLAVLTTNVYPQLYYQMLDRLHAQGWKTQTRFTDEDGFDTALEWYQRHSDLISAQEQTKNYRQYVTGADAIALIKELYQKKETLSEGEFMTEIMRLAFQAGCSDLHFQSEEMGVVMRVRKDGILQTVLIFSHVEFKKYLLKIKFIAGVKMNVEAVSQDGRFNIMAFKDKKTIKIDIRVSVMPSLRGESIVLRFLDGSKSLLNLNQLGCMPYHQEILTRYLHKNYGLILLTGPTGSGKTTTVYTMLQMLNMPDKKIITLEDPVEYELPGLEQNQINEGKGFTFEEGLKGMLRHDPDIIMVWEIRSLESAEMAINAALTGHLVISTLHTNTAVEAITRLLNMGVKPYMLAPALQLVVGQRLLRKLAVKKEIPVPLDMKNEIQNAATHLEKVTGDASFAYRETIYTAQDPEDREKWYEGRVGAFECFEVTPSLKEAMINGQSTNEILKLAQQQWYLTMREDAFGKVLKWETSLEEIQRVL